MRYQYCEECGKPIRARSTFEESVIRGIASRKKLEDTCGESTVYCRDCWIKLKKQFNKIDCDNTHCRKMKDNKCMFLVENIVEVKE